MISFVSSVRSKPFLFIIQFITTANLYPMQAVSNYR
jgi:hypothetical protein